jgi:hypothetical protein
MNFDSSGIYSIGLYNVGTNTKSWLWDFMYQNQPGYLELMRD